MSSLIVLVSGPPASGKTTIARTLAPLLKLPLVAKDDIKESLSDSLGKTGLVWSKRLGAATWDVLFVLIERFIADGASAIFESNFYPDDHRDRLLELQCKHPFVPFEIHCFAEPTILAQRNNARARHPVHHSASGITASRASRWATNNAPLELSEHVVRVDTGAAEPVDLDGIVTKIRRIADGL